MSLTIDRLRCLRCRHQWLPRSSTLPKVCPRCKSTKWDVPKPVQGG